MSPTTVKKQSARKSLCIFTNILNVKNKTATRRVGAYKSKRKAIKYGTTPWALKPKRKINSIINDQIRKSLYNWIMHHPQIVQSPNYNYCLKVIIDGHTGPKIVPKLLLHVSARELHNSFVSDPVDVVITEARDAENSINISDSTLH